MLSDLSGLILLAVAYIVDSGDEGYLDVYATAVNAKSTVLSALQSLTGRAMIARLAFLLSRCSLMSCLFLLFLIWVEGSFILEQSDKQQLSSSFPSLSLFLSFCLFFFFLDCLSSLFPFTASVMKAKLL